MRKSFYTFASSMKIEKYIEKLLLNHDCVIIPTLGGFVTRYESAYRNDDNGMFYPPTRTLGFNSMLNMNDGLLVQAYMQAYDTNFPEANRMVERDVNVIKQTLQQEGCYVFENIGILEVSDGGYTFSPKDESGVAAPELYGLDAFSIVEYVPRAVGYENTTEENGKLDDESFLADEIDEREKGYSKHYVVHINKSLVHYAVAVITAVVFYLMLSVPMADMSEKSNCQMSVANGMFYHFPITNQNNRTVEVIPSSKPIDSHVESVSVEPESSVETIQQGSSKELTPVIEELYYTLVLASSVKLSNAETFIQRLSAKGLMEGAVYDNGNIRRVVYAKYASENEAYNALSSLKGKDKSFQDAWVMRVTPGLK